MEINELRHIWRSVDASDAPKAPTLLEFAAGRGRLPIRKMRRTVVFQAATLVLAYTAAFFFIQPRFRLPVGLLYGSLCGAYAVYYWKKFSLLRSMERLDGQALLASLRGKLTLLKGYIRFYSYSRYYVLPLAFGAVLAILWVYRRDHFYIFLGHHFRSGQEALVIACWSVGTLLLMIPFGYLSDRWMFRKYGRYIRELEADLSELQ